MNLEKFAATMRPRFAFEAVDLGFLIARRFWPRLIAGWLLVSLPVLLAMALLLPGIPALGLMFFWWLKPLFERPLLFVLSRALFGALPRWREVFSWRALGPGLLGDLLWRRLSPHRSLTMPVTLLEGSSGPVARQRRLLIGSIDFAGGGLTYGCWLAEMALLIAFFFFLDLLLPSGYTGFDGVDFESGEWPAALGLAFYAGYYLASSLVEPFYVGGGFLLYLQRRASLEGWDVELAFRRMVQRRQAIDAGSARRAGAAAGLANRPASRAASLLLALGLALAALSPAPLPAQEPAPQAVSGEAAAPEAAGGEAGGETAEHQPLPEEVHQAIEKIKASPEFGGVREQETWRYKGGKPLFDPSGADLPRASLPIPWGLLRWLLLALLIAFVLFFGYRAWRDRASFASGPPAARKPAAERRFGLEEDPLAPIGDVTARARQALAAGQPEQALAWLYRGAFQELAGRGFLPLRRDFTEDDCLRHLRRKAAGRPAPEAAAALPFEQLFQQIAGLWMRAAYGHFAVEKAEVARLCAAFDRVFAAAPGEAAA